MATPEKSDAPPAKVPASHHGRLHLDQVGPTTFQLTDTVTLEKKNVHGQHWEIIYDSDGRAAVAGIDANGEPVSACVSDLFRKDLSHDGKGERYLAYKQADGVVTEQSLDHALTKHRDATVELRLGAAVALGTIEIYVMALARACAARIYWGLFALYRLLGLKTFSQQPSKWTYNGMPRWKKWVSKLLPGEHFTLSRHWNRAAEAMQSTPWNERCFAQPACSTVALLVLLSTWAFCAPAKGGMKEEGPRAAARSVLEALIEKAAEHHDGGWEFPLVLDMDWKCLWPRPAKTYKDGHMLPEIFLRLQAPGMLDISALFEVGDGEEADLVQRRWVASLLKAGVGKAMSRLPLVDILEVVAPVGKLDAMTYQILLQVAVQLESCFSDTAGKDEGDTVATFAFKSLAPSPGDENMEQKLYAYVIAGITESKKHNTLTIGTDKASPAFQSLANSVIVYPNGVAVVCCPQVDKGFTDDTLVEGAGSRQGTKRKILEVETGLAPPDAERQLNWMQRSSSTVLPKMWRPPTLHRAAARRWVLALDNQIRGSTCWLGLAHFRHDPEAPEWQTWQSWPGLGISLDCGADGVAGVSALMYGYDLNMWIWPDPSHSCQRSFEGVLREVGIWSFWLLLLISWNLEHGPHSDRHRHSQLREALSLLLELRTPEQCPLFLQLAPQMARELEDGNLAHFPRERSLEQELWDWLRTRAKGGQLGRRVSMNRFGGTQHAAMQHRPLWTVELFERSFLALELDFLGGHRFVDKLTVKQQDGASLSGGSTCPRQLQIDDRALRAVCQNAVAISVVTLDDMSHKRVVDMVLAAQAPLDAYHTDQNRRLRDVSETRKWLLEQVCGGVGNHLEAFMRLLSCLTSLANAGFVLPGVNMSSTAAEPDEDLQILIEDESADMFALMCLSFVSHRASRLLFLQGWPTRFLGALASEDEAARTFSAFEEDERLWREFVDLPAKSAHLKLIEQRGVMNLRCVKQVSEAFSQQGYTMTDALKKVLEERAAGLVQTQIIEDCHGYQKNSSWTSTGRRFRKASVSMAVVLEQDVVASRHRFKNPGLLAPMRSADSKLEDEHFHPDRQAMSFDFSGIASTAAQAPWWSPSASGMMAPHTDFELLRQAKAKGSFHKASDAWLGEAFCLTNRIAFGFPLARGKVEWFICLKHFPKGPVLCWRADLKKLAGANIFYLEPEFGAESMCLKAVFSVAPGDLKVVCFDWRSWAWQSKFFPAAARKSLSPAIRPIVDKHGVQSLQTAGARAAWWSLSRSTLSDYARHFGLQIEAGASLTDLLWAMLQGTLKTDDAATLEILHRRVARDANHNPHSEVLMQVDEALEVVDHMDVRKVQTAQQEAKSSATSKASFKADYIAKATAVREATARASASSRRGGRSSAEAAASSSARRLQVPPHHCTQAEAKALIPPGSSIWRSLTRGEWCAHLDPDHKRITEPFSRHGGSKEALTQCLRRLWAQHFDKTGQPYTNCPVEGLFE